MLIKLIKTHRRSGFILLPLLVGGILANQLFSPESQSADVWADHYVLAGFLNSLTGSYHVAKTVLGSLIVLINGILLFRIYREYLFPSSWSMLPALLFLVLTAGMPQYLVYHPVWFAVIFLILATDRLFASYDIRKPFSNMFDSGFFLSLGSLFCFDLLYLLPAFIYGGSMMGRDTRWREPLLVFIGALVPWLFTFSTYFMLDKTGVLLDSIGTGFLKSDQSLLTNIPLLVYLGFLLLLTIAASLTIIRQYTAKKVRFRKFFTFFFLVFISSIIALVLIPGTSGDILIVAGVPLTFLLSNYFESVRRNITAEIMFTLITGFAAYFQVFG